MGDKMKILFLCTGNSCRSQMAEGFVKAYKAEKIEAYSAGVEKKPVDPRAIQVMQEVGLDISGQRSKSLEELPEEVEFDYVITLCDDAHQSCPVFPARTMILHIGFDDPPRLAAEAKSEEEALGHYRRVRDEIKALVESLPEGLKKYEEDN